MLPILAGERSKEERQLKPAGPPTVGLYRSGEGHFDEKSATSLQVFCGLKTENPIGITVVTWLTIL
jgi:hypothetical protein